MKHETRITRLHIVPEGDPIFSEQATEIEIANESAGEFVVVSQPSVIGDYEGKVCIDPANWPAIKDAIEKLLADCRD
jgi:hypothetical protein